MSLVDFVIVVVILAVICIYHGVKAKSAMLIGLTVVFHGITGISLNNFPRFSRDYRLAVQVTFLTTEYGTINQARKQMEGISYVI